MAALGYACPRSGPIASNDQTVLADRYRLIRPLGVGGMGTVYLAKHLALGKRVAVKVLADRFVDDPVASERFVREAQATSRIRHPNVIEISDFGETDQGAPFFVMEHLEGEDLGQTLHRAGRMPWSRVADIAKQIAGALAAAHEVDVVHRDLKPENCVRVDKVGGAEVEGDLIKVIDFGVAKLLGSVADQSARLTKTGILVGTAEYVAPELAWGRGVDHRVDVYALGVILYELLTGRLPFIGENFVDVLSASAYEPAPTFAEVAPDLELPDGVEAIVRKAMHKRPDRRFQSMPELVEAIDDLVERGVALPLEREDATARPTLDGPMPFATADAINRAIQAEMTQQAEAERKPDRPWLRAVGVGLAVAVLGAALGLGWLWLRDRPKLAMPRVELPRADPADPAVDSAAEAAEPRPPRDLVTVRIESNVDARILDPLDGAVYGWTNDPDGFALDRDDEVVALRLHAPGYVDADIEVTPTEDLELEQALAPEKQRKKRRKRKDDSPIKDPFAHPPL